jgi:hypothetical protein
MAVGTMAAMITKKNEKESRRPTKMLVDVVALVDTYAITPGKAMEMINGNMIVV